MMIQPKNLIGPAALLVAVVTAGCAATATPGYDERFGDAARALTAQQLIDPTAPARNGDRVAATDGRTVREAGDRQVDTFRAPPPPSVINIGVGGSR